MLETSGQVSRWARGGGESGQGEEVRRTRSGGAPFSIHARNGHGSFGAFGMSANG